MNNLQQTTLWLGATRYYIGRMSAGVSDFCELLIQEWPNLPEQTQRLIRREVDEAIAKDDEDRAAGREYKRMGMDCDRAEWDKVARLWAGKCAKCGGDMTRGHAIAQTFSGMPDFIGGEVCTMSPGGPGRLIDCMKCAACGWSVAC